MSQQIVDRFAQGVEIAKQAGWDVRFANLGGSGGGWCRMGDRSLVFVDLSLDVMEQLDRLEDAMQMALNELADCVPSGIPLAGEQSKQASHFQVIQQWLDNSVNITGKASFSIS